MYRHLILEACVESLAEAIQAEINGAHRLELCSRLDLDGFTPDLELTKQVLDRVKVPVKVMIRPKGGDFVYSDVEFEKMKDEINFFKTLNIQGVVFGILDETNHLNLKQIQSLADLAFPMEVTIHKAIDETPNILQSVSELLSVDHITSILTSGGSATAIEGKETIQQMINLAGKNLKIIPAGRITSENLNEVHHLIGSAEYHGRKIVGQLD